jgi:hypothetical protein
MRPRCSRSSTGWPSRSPPPRPVFRSPIILVTFGRSVAKAASPDRLSSPCWNACTTFITSTRNKGTLRALGNLRGSAPSAKLRTRSLTRSCTGCVRCAASSPRPTSSRTRPGSSPSTQIHGAALKDDGRATDLDGIHCVVRRLCVALLLAPVLADRAMYLATLYVLERRASSGCPQLIAASCVVYALLETWARLLVPVKVFKNQQWTTWWVLPTRSLKQRLKD